MPIRLYAPSFMSPKSSHPNEAQTSNCTKHAAPPEGSPEASVPQKPTRMPSAHSRERPRHTYRPASRHNKRTSPLHGMEEATYQSVTCGYGLTTVKQLAIASMYAHWQVLGHPALGMPLLNTPVRGRLWAYSVRLPAIAVLGALVRARAGIGHRRKIELRGAGQPVTNQKGFVTWLRGNAVDIGYWLSGSTVEIQKDCQLTRHA
ncbi:hypothetical protein ASPZODRAFT_147156 [Penicilliopsis zonata CBS 506.65]|uniref:Uncharacterized protein n=1 Tax=Penicilliopsis zonata CBS 506.65 TaxID=1073090 RepID=A0A1L9S5S4_9EURO|nr:hypothetical protein ASPZODRAFT_147156 [Penicilliopsis zonata CBS 506.65]OJJ42514.1 hypothetical protein ASPZODRAFT_147156 [Penicilliopsis zonata CBS 506.65]